MKASAWSIRNLLVVVLVLCADFYLIRNCFDRDLLVPYFAWPEAFRCAFLGSLPMTSLVVIGGSIILSRGGRGRPFLAGFVLSGALAFAGLLVVSLAIPPGWLRGIDPLNRMLANFLARSSGIEMSVRQSGTISSLVIFTVVFTIPELLIATAGGWVARRLPGRSIGLHRSEPGTEEAAMSQKKIHDREDVTPETGEHKYGDVEFADPVNKKYPVDTPEHVRAAWSYINHADNAAKYQKSEVETIKGHIKRAAGKHGVEIDAD